MILASKKISLAILLSLAVFTGCSKTETTASVNQAAGGGNANATQTANQSPVNAANTNITTNAATKPTVDNSPKRIAFGKGQNWGAVSVSLAPNATRLFVVGAKAGQTMDVEASSKDAAINLRKGKAKTTEDFGYLNAELQSNGDYVFEVKNISKKEVKTSIKVTIEGGGEKSKNKEESEIDESDATVKDDKEVLPPPTKKGGN